MNWIADCAGRIMSEVIGVRWLLGEKRRDDHTLCTGFNSSYSVVTGTNESLLVTAVFGIVKLTAVIGCALFLVEFIGRMRVLLIGISLQAIAMIYVAAFVPQLENREESYIISLSELGPSRGAIAMIYRSVL